MRVGKHRDKRVESFHRAYCLWNGCGGYRFECMHATFIRWLAGYRRLWQKESNGLLSTIPILNVFGRLERRSTERERKKKRRDTERRENWVGAHHVVIQHKKLPVAMLKSLLVWQHKEDRLNRMWTLKFTSNGAAAWLSVTWVKPSVSEEQSVWLAISRSSSELSRALEQALSWLWEKTNLQSNGAHLQTPTGYSSV